MVSLSNDRSTRVGNQLQAVVSIQGTRPLLWNHLHPSEEFGKRKERVGSAGNDPSEWQNSVLMTEERQLYLLPTHIFGCLRDAARHTRRGKSTLMPQIASTLQVVERRILVDQFVPDAPLKATEELEEPVYIYLSVVRNVTTRGRNIRYRIAAAPGWQCSFTLHWDRTIVSREEMEAIVWDSGRLTGVGDGRGIGFGRFTILQCELQG